MADVEDEFENDANKANYEELGEHIKLLSAKAKVSKLNNNQIEDLEDYYERALQLRMMHNTTLTEQLKDEKTKQSVEWRAY